MRNLGQLQTKTMIQGFRPSASLPTPTRLLAKESSAWTRLSVSPGRQTRINARASGLPKKTPAQLVADMQDIRIPVEVWSARHESNSR